MSNDPVRDGMDDFDAALAAVKEARRHGGLNWTKIARDHGVSVTTLRRAGDPDFRERDNARRAAAKRARGPQRHTSYLLVRGKKPRAEEFAARLAEIPEDTRSITGRLMGDPLRGRSALDREKRDGLPPRMEAGR